jgi:hypothetical protein
MGDLQDDAEGKDFDRRLALLDRMLKNKDLELKAVPKATPSAPVPGPVGPSTQGVPS